MPVQHLIRAEARKARAALDPGAVYRPGRLRALWNTTIGKKYVVAITGAIMGLYVLLHMLANLKSLQGPGGGHPAIDRYAEWLRTVGSPLLPRNFALWSVRAILVFALVLHVVAITQLTRRNLAARPVGHRPQRARSTLAARTMLASGLVLLAFIVFHILQFTTRTIHPTPLVQGDVYANLHDAFEKWYLAVPYIAAMLLLGMHLWHALWSAAQTTGFDNPDRNWFWRRLAGWVTVAVVVGFIAVPVLFWTGVLPDPVRGSGVV